MANALELIDAELERASTPRVARKPVMLYLAEGHKAIIRPLYELKNSLVLQKHSKWTQEKESRISAICAREKCKYCQAAFG